MVEDKLTYILFYFKCYSTFDLAELLSERVVCEQAFAGLKRYGIAHQVYRNRKDSFDDRSMVTVAERWNFYLEAASLGTGKYPGQFNWSTST